MQTSKQIFLMLAGMILLQTGLSGQAQSTDLSPLDLIKARNQQVENIIEQAGDSVNVETKEQLKDVINGCIDFTELSRIALGKYWQPRSQIEKTDFVNVFQKLIRNSSVKKLEVYKADKNIYDEPEINGSKAKVVQIAQKKRKQVEIIYKLHRVDNDWKVYDMDIDGVSTARNYRESFYRQIAKTSYEAMYDKLVKRLARD